jgi:hypothetical protein
MNKTVVKDEFNDEKPKTPRERALWRAKETCRMGISEFKEIYNPRPEVRVLFYVMRVLEDIIMVMGEDKK